MTRFERFSALIFLARSLVILVGLVLFTRSGALAGKALAMGWIGGALDLAIALFWLSGRRWLSGLALADILVGALWPSGPTYRFVWDSAKGLFLEPYAQMSIASDGFSIELSLAILVCLTGASFLISLRSIRLGPSSPPGRR